MLRHSITDALFEGTGSLKKNQSCFLHTIHLAALLLRALLKQRIAWAFSCEPPSGLTQLSALHAPSLRLIKKKNNSKNNKVTQTELYPPPKRSGQKWVGGGKGHPSRVAARWRTEEEAPPEGAAANGGDSVRNEEQQRKARATHRPPSPPHPHPAGTAIQQGGWGPACLEGSQGGPP